MKTRVSVDESSLRRLQLVMWCLVCVICATVTVPVVAVSSVAFEEDLGESREPSGQDVEEMRKSVELQLGSPYWVNTRLDEEAEESIAEGAVLFSKDECTRYCIERGTVNNEDNFNYINFFWFTNGTDTTNNFLPQDYQQLITPGVTRADHQNSNVSEDCQIYLDLDCDTTKAGTNTNYIKKPFYPNVQNSEEDQDIFSEPTLQSPTKIVEKFNLNENTLTKFVVDSTMPRIVINVDGNISKALLRIPMNATVPWPGTVISWRRKGDADGVRIDTRNAPPGEWWMKLTGEDDSNYHFTAKGFAEERGNEAEDKLFSPESPTKGNLNEIPVTRYHSHVKIRNDEKLDNKTSNDFTKTIDSEVITAEQQKLDAVINSELIDNGKITSKRSLEHQLLRQEQNNQATMENFNDDSSTENAILNYVEYVTFTGNDNNLAASSNNSNNNEEISDTMLLLEKQEKIDGRSSIGVTGDVDTDNIRTSFVNDIRVSMKMIETLDNQELSQDLVTHSNENTIEGRKMLIEVNRNSNLLVTPGTIHRIVFDVRNGCILPVRYAYRVKSTPFRVVGLQPSYAWIYPGQMNNVAVDLVIPDNAAPDTANTVTLFIPGTEIKEKSAYLYVQGSLSKLTDDVKPKIQYSFNNNCAEKLGKSDCYKSHWSADITIQDYDSGLKRVISSPNEIYPRTEFVSGTRSPVTFYYSATCCDTTAKITAMDLLDNYDTYTVDVTAWNNLSEAQIAAITVGALLAFLLIVFIIILIVYCFRRRDSHDLPYTQRYGSRSPPHTERTSC